jgi:hypothetical protein
VAVQDWGREKRVVSGRGEGQVCDGGEGGVDVDMLRVGLEVGDVVIVRVLLVRTGGGEIWEVVILHGRGMSEWRGTGLARGRKRMWKRGYVRARLHGTDCSCAC